MQQLAKAERLLVQHNERLSGARPGTAGSLRGTMGFNDRDDGMNNFIPGFSESTPRSQSEKLADYLTNELHQKGIAPARIYAMADSKRSNQVRFSLILDSLMKMLPNLTRDFVDQIPPVFELSPSDLLSMEDFTMLFDNKAQIASNTGPQSSAVKKRNQLAKNQGNEELTALLKYLNECIEKEGITASRLFKQADKNHNMVLTCEELRDAVKDGFPESFNGLNFKKLVKAFDQNNNGLIEEQEFVSLLTQAGSSGADTSQYHRITGALGGPSGKKQPKASESKNTVTLVDMVKPEHRITAKGCVDYLRKLMITENRIDTPTDEITSIFEKVTSWKQKAGDLDQQEKMVAKKMKTVEKLKIHNIVTAYQKLEELRHEI